MNAGHDATTLSCPADDVDGLAQVWPTNNQSVSKAVVPARGPRA
jgi:hypothetical protein